MSHLFEKAFHLFLIMKFVKKWFVVCHSEIYVFSHSVLSVILQKCATMGALSGRLPELVRALARLFFSYSLVRFQCPMSCHKLLALKVSRVAWRRSAEEENYELLSRGVF